MGGLASPPGAAPGQAVPPDFNGPGSGQLDSWIAIGADGSVTAYTGKCELGQGLYTAQTQLIAEELSVPFDRVKLIQCDTALTPDQGTTSGAQSHPANFNRNNLALAGATAVPSSAWCPSRCGGRMSVIATIEAGDVMRKILGHLGLPDRPPSSLLAGSALFS